VDQCAPRETSEAVWQSADRLGGFRIPDHRGRCRIWVLPITPLNGTIHSEVRTVILHTDTRRRITLPPNSGIKPGDAIDLEILEDGRIMLVPIEAVPKHQLWAWTAESKHAIETSMSDPRPSEVIETPEQVEKVAKRWADED
jgi:uncharacterized protein YqfB (UPF0267 family)